MLRIRRLAARAMVLAAVVLCAAPAQAGLTDAYVGCSNSDDVLPFDPLSLAEGASIPLPSSFPYPYDATITPDGQEVWIADASGDEVIVIDRATDAIVSRIATGEYVVSVEFSLDGSLAFVGSRMNDRLDVIDVASRTLVDSLPFFLVRDPIRPEEVGQIGVHPTTGNLYVAAWYDGDFYEVSADGSTHLRQLELGDSLWSVRVAKNGSVVYVTDRGTDEVRIVDIATFTEITTVPVGDDPWGLDITDDGSTVTVACEDSSELWLIDTATLATTVVPLPVDSDPRDVDILDSRGEAFVPGGQVGPFGSVTSPVYVVDLASATLVRQYDSAGGNTNVVAVWPPGTDPCGTSDMDGDGIGDLCDNCPMDLNPLQGDTDSDGVGNVCDNCPDVANPDQADADGNGVGDACECFGPDMDADGVPDECDNCPGVANPDQTDTDGNGVGDACEDRDSDGIPDSTDNCPDVFNPDQADADGNGIGDACECSGPDTDGDGIPDECDNCPDVANPDQTDSDGNGIGDACECSGPDLDADGVPDECDNCPDVANPDQTDSDGNGVGDACEPPPECFDAPEVQDLRVVRDGTNAVLSWTLPPDVEHDWINVYSGFLDAFGPDRTYSHGSVVGGCSLVGLSSFAHVGVVGDGQPYYWLVVASCAAGGEGSYGTNALDEERPTAADVGMPNCP